MMPRSTCTSTLPRSETMANIGPGSSFTLSLHRTLLVYRGETHAPIIKMTRHLGNSSSRSDLDLGVGGIHRWNCRNCRYSRRTVYEDDTNCRYSRRTTVYEDDTRALNTRERLRRGEAEEGEARGGAGIAYILYGITLEDCYYSVFLSVVRRDTAKRERHLSNQEASKLPNRRLILCWGRLAKYLSAAPRYPREKTCAIYVSAGKGKNATHVPLSFALNTNRQTSRLAPTPKYPGPPCLILFAPYTRTHNPGHTQVAYHNTHEQTLNTNAITFPELLFTRENKWCHAQHTL